MRWIACAGLALAAGCVAPTDVKDASAEVGVALKSLGEARGEFEKLYVREIEATRQQIGRAIVARAVVETVAGLAEEEAAGNLIEVSTQIGQERDAWRATVNAVLAAKQKDTETPEATVARVLSKRAGELRTAADALEAAGMTDSARKLRERADELEADGGLDPVSLGDMAVIVELQGMKADVRSGMADLADYLSLLQMMQGQVHEWITTDVNVSGAKVAQLMDRVTGGGR